MKSSVSTSCLYRVRLTGLLSALLLLSAIGNTASAATLIINRRDAGLPPSLRGPILVNLYHKGKPIRSLELAQKTVKVRSQVFEYENKPVPVSAKLTGLPPGQYEVHFHAVGYGEIVKNVYCSDENETEVFAEIGKEGDKNTILVGGPPLQEIRQLLQELKADNSDLRAKVERLEAEIKQLKATKRGR